MSKYIYQQKDWPKFHWNDESIISLLSSIRHNQGRLLGNMEALGFNLRSEALLESLTINILKTSEIEGEILNPEQVRSSIARRLGIEIGGLVPSDRNIDGVVEMMLDATQNFNEPLTEDRLFGWHSALFPGGRSGMYKIKVGNWRDDSKGPMQVISGAIGREKVHYEAPSAISIQNEINQFLDWFNSDIKIDPVLKASISHFWFITIHPFEDGNGRIARAIADMQLTRADGSSQRFYSMSAQIQKERNKYYDILESSQKESLDITNWLNWFLACLNRSLDSTDTLLAKVIDKAKFWDRFSNIKLNERQILILNKLLDGFEGKLTSTKWAKLTKCSQDTALRDIQNLIEKKALIKETAGGRSTSYMLNIHR
ncbi:MAG TPA: Fic family protein [Chitinophagaceae bacterium]|nr:Fic family protein [Chitinophagaceae bacterium]